MQDKRRLVMAKILYIEDDESTRNCVELMMTRLGHNVMSREDTDKAFAIVDIWKPDLVITDHNLGEGKEKGLQLALRLKADKVNVVMLSSDDNALSGAKRADIPFFMKPCLIRNMLAELEI
jgi:two-component system response regulator PilR (NtrC family)